MRRRAAASSFTVAALAALVLAVQTASAKEGARAHLLTRPPAGAHAGTIVTVRWTVTVPGAHGSRTPFRANGMFVRLVGARGASSTATARQYAPPYSVRIRVPGGGIRAIRVGLHGVADGPAGPRPAPVFFPLR